MGRTIGLFCLQHINSAFGPAADGKLVFNDYQQRNKEGKFIKVVSETHGLDTSMSTVTTGAHKMLFRLLLSFPLFNFRTIKYHETDFKQPLLIGNNDNESGFFAMMNPRTKQDPATAKQRNAGFECPSGAAADARRLQGVPSWRYRYMPNKAVHGAEIGSVFGTGAGWVKTRFRVLTKTQKPCQM